MKQTTQTYNSMKKFVLTIAILLGLGLSTFAHPNGDGLFGRGESTDQSNPESSLFTPKLPLHGQTGNQPAPLGSGIFVLTALGAAYLIGNRRKEDYH